MKSSDRDGSENQAFALALLQLARDVLEGRADVRIADFGSASWIEYRTFENRDGVSVTASKAIAIGDGQAPAVHVDRWESGPL